VEEKMKRSTIGLFIVMMGLVMLGCKNPETDTPIAVTFSSLTADGTSGSVTTTTLTLVFDHDPTTLAVGNITVTGATKGALSGTGTTRTLAISVITVANGANVTVALTSPTGYLITPAIRAVAIAIDNTEGTLTAYSEGDPSSTNLVAGTSSQLVSKYRFHASHESFMLNIMTVLNDSAGGFETAIDTHAISGVTVKYTDSSNAIQSKYAVLVNGIATFTGMGMYIPKDSDSFLEIYADINTRNDVGETISGLVFRLGIQETANTISTFEATGISSSIVVTSPLVYNSSSINEFVVRTTKPIFAKLAIGTNLSNGELNLYAVAISADVAGTVGFARLVFHYSLSGITIASPTFYRGSTKIINATVTDDSAGHIIVAFDQEESISAGASINYYLKATVAGVSAGDYITTNIDSGDEESVTGLDSNKGRIYATTGIFTTATTDFSILYGTNRSIIWSDKSADTHTYATVTSGSVVLGSGSADWTNGYRLKAIELTSSTLSN
jgi:hypothetical protein